MAILQNTLIGRAKRSIGGVTFSTWKGLNVGKSKPVSVANPKTPKQIMRRSALSQIVELFRLVPNAANIGFRALAIHQSPYNAFASENLKTAFDYSAPPIANMINNEIKFSKGSIAATPITTYTSSIADGATIVEWDDSVLGVGQSATDLGSVVLHDLVTNVWYSGTNQNPRNAGLISIPAIDFPQVLGHEVDVYLFFASSTNSTVSDSVYDSVNVTA